MKSMKTLLLSTALVAISGATFADNFKTQLNNIDSASQCINHFDRDAADIAGNVNQFEFCVWHINNNREAFTRDTHWYSILPSGNVVAVKQNLLTSNHKAKRVIEAAVLEIVKENLKKEHAANVAAIKASHAETVGDLSDKIED